MAYRQQSPFDRSPLGGIGGLLIALVVLYLLFRLVGLFFKILWWAAPVIFIASLIIDHRVFLGYLKSIQNLFKRNWIYGLVAAVLSFVAFPLVAAYCLGMALFRKKVDRVRAEHDERVNGQWTDYEDVTTEEMDLELPPPPEPLPREERKKKDGGSEYDELFL